MCIYRLQWSLWILRALDNIATNDGYSTGHGTHLTLDYGVQPHYKEVISFKLRKMNNIWTMLKMLLTNDSHSGTVNIDSKTSFWLGSIGPWYMNYYTGAPGFLHVKSHVNLNTTHKSSSKLWVLSLSWGDYFDIYSARPTDRVQNTPPSNHIIQTYKSLIVVTHLSDYPL